MKMAHAVILFLGLLITEYHGVAATPSNSEHESCKIWDRLAKQLTTSTGTQQVCHSSGIDPCTRIDCNGAYEYNSENTAGSFVHLGSMTYEVDYCFGVILNHCDHNISLDFYMQVPDRGVDQTTRVYHNTLLSIPGLSYSSNSSSSISAEGYLYFQMERQADTVTFSVTVKVRMKFSSLVYWPDELQRRLIRNETVPVPPCEAGANNGSSATPAIAQCKPPHWKKGHSPSGGRGEAKLDKPCEQTAACSTDPWLVCDLNSKQCVCGPDFVRFTEPGTGVKACRPKIQHGLPCGSDDGCNLAMSERCLNGTCHCQEGDVFNSYLQTCEPKHQGGWKVTRIPHLETDSPSRNRGRWLGGATVLPHVEPLPAKRTTGKKAGQNKAAIIAASVVGSLMVLGGILLVAYFAIRRLRRPYHNRELLLEGEDSDSVIV